MTIEYQTGDAVLHSGVYRVRQDVQSVIHTHSPNVTSFALASGVREPPTPARGRTRHTTS